MAVVVAVVISLSVSEAAKIENMVIAGAEEG